MAQYDSTASDVSNSIGESRPNTNLQDAVNNLLEGLGDSVKVESEVSTAAAATSSDADVLFMNLGEGERGTQDAPLQFDDSGREDGRAYVFDGDEGVNAEFNTVERVIIGTNGDDVFTVDGGKDTTVDGGAGNDVITTSSGDDSITGGAGDDTIDSGAGNDSIYGGAGNDEAIFAGNADDYTIEHDGAITTVTNNETGDVNEVVNVEEITFDDGTQDVELSSDVQALATLYKQIFSSTDARENNGDGQADLDGMQYWAERADEGTSLGKIALNMINSDEANNQLADLDLGTSDGMQSAIELLYTDVLGREASTDELAYWTGEADAGATLEDIASDFVSSDEFQQQNVDAPDMDFLL